MLPYSSLDTQTFSQILEKAQKTIHQYYPDWTDENYHDPGITFLELFAWLKEMQQFYIDQISPQNYRQYIKLLCGSVHHAQPAQAKVRALHITTLPKESKNIFYALPKGTRAYAGKIPFESIDPGEITLADGSGEQRRIAYLSAAALRFIPEDEKKWKCYPFGKDLKPSSCFFIHFNKPFQAGRTARLDFEIFEEYCVKRNPVEGDFIALAQLNWAYYTQDGWEVLEVKDNTNQLIRSGTVEFNIGKEMFPLEDGTYCIRCTLQKHSYDVAPLIHSIHLNTVSLRQTHTFSQVCDITTEAAAFTTNTHLSMFGNRELYRYEEGIYHRVQDYSASPDLIHGQCTYQVKAEGTGVPSSYKLICCEDSFVTKRVLGYANGFPSQKFEMDAEGQIICYDHFQLMIGTAASASGTFDALESWQKVDDFNSSNQYDRHYTLDEETGQIRFGNGIYGRMPKGYVLVTSFGLTYGEEGNVKQYQIRDMPYAGTNIEVMNENHAFGGVNQETIERTLSRLRQEVTVPTRAVTKSDYESIVSRTPGLMIEKVSAYTPDKRFMNQYECSPNTVVVVVKSFSDGKQAKLSKAYTANITNYLEQYRLAGTEIIVQSPEYVTVELYADFSVEPYYSNASDTIKQKIADYFVQECGDFGCEIQYVSIFGIIDKNDWVKNASALVIDAKGDNIIRKQNGNIVLPPNGLCRLGSLHFTIR